MRYVITVGIGDYNARFLTPTLKKLENEGLIKLLATVDIKPSLNAKDNVEHIVRRGEPLSELLLKFKEQDPLILLAHVNHMHANDTIDLSTNGFKVALEKPYAPQVESLRTLYHQANLKNVFFLEYYLMMKSIPLLLGYGKVHKDSSYIDLLIPKKELNKFAKSTRDFFGVLPEIVGDIQAASVDVIEGEGETGRLDHRGIATIDIRAGGGMIQDMLIHGLVTLVALENEIGRIENYSSRIAISNEYLEMAKNKFGLNPKHIGESYVEVKGKTSKETPIKVRVGKYLYNNLNVRGITLQGTKSKVFLDMNPCILYINELPVLEIMKDEYKYYPVIRAALDYFDKKPLFKFDQNEVTSNAQELVLEIQDNVYRMQQPAYYSSGITPEEVFKQPENEKRN